MGPLTVASSAAWPVAIAAEARQFQEKIDDFGPLESDVKKALRKGLKMMCRECQMGVAAAQRALADAGFAPGSLEPERTGVSFGSDYMITLADDFTEGVVECLDERGKFEFARWAGQGLPKMNPLWLLKYLPNMPASHVAIYNNFTGPSNSITLREASANVVVAESYQIVAGRPGGRHGLWVHRHAAEPDQDGPRRPTGTSRLGQRRSNQGKPAVRS